MAVPPDPPSVARGLRASGRPRRAPSPRPAPRSAAARALVLALALLGGCATRPTPPRLPPATGGGVGPGPGGPDGPPTHIPVDLAAVPDATPRVETLRSGGPNKPYEVFGVRYEPLAGDVPLADAGLASWYGTRFHGRPTSSGEPYDMFAMTAAHRTMPIPSYARVRNPANGRQVVVRVNDRGPFVAGRVIDLSYAAAWRLGVLAAVSPVVVERITHAEIARAAPAAAAPAAPPATDRDAALRELLRALGERPEP